MGQEMTKLRRTATATASAETASAETASAATVSATTVSTVMAVITIRAEVKNAI